MHSKDNQYQAGRYIQQASGYRAFYPKALPPEPNIEFSDELQKLLSKANRALGRLDGSIQTLPNPDHFVAMYVRKEAVLSSQIEGTQSSLHDVLAAESHILSASTPKDVNEVINYVYAMNSGLEDLETLPISVRLIRNIHKRLLKGVRGQDMTPGELRRSQNWIGPPGCTLSEATFVPPPHHEVPNMLGDLEKFIHSESSLPLLVKIGLTHAQFETIHPFLDGNGRIGRLLITFLLCEREVLIKPVLYLSYYFKKHRNKYYELLQNVRENGAWEEWLVFFLNGINEVCKEASETARNLLVLREKHREIIIDKLGRAAANGLRVLEHLYRSPMISVKEVQSLTKISYPAANKLVKQLVTAGVLIESTGYSRNRIFTYSDYLNLFHN